MVGWDGLVGVGWVWSEVCVVAPVGVAIRVG